MRSPAPSEAVWDAEALPTSVGRGFTVYVFNLPGTLTFYSEKCTLSCKQIRLEAKDIREDVISARKPVPLLGEVRYFRISSMHEGDAHSCACGLLRTGLIALSLQGNEAEACKTALKL